MFLRTAATLSLLLLAACEEKNSSSGSSGSSGQRNSTRSDSTTSGSTIGPGAARPDAATAIDLAKQELQGLLDKGAPSPERAVAVESLASAYGHGDPRAGATWILSLEDPQDRESAWPALILASQESAPAIGLSLYGKLSDPAAKEEYLAALTGTEVLLANPDLSWSYAQALVPKGSARDALEETLLRRQAAINPNAAWEAYQKHVSDAAETSFIKKFPLPEDSNAPPGTGPKFPIAVIDGIRNRSQQAADVALALEKLDSNGRQIVTQWLTDQPKDARFDASYSSLALSHANLDPQAARMWATRITDDARRAEALKAIETAEPEEAPSEPKK